MEGGRCTQRTTRARAYRSGKSRSTAGAAEIILINENHIDEAAGHARVSGIEQRGEESASDSALSQMSQRREIIAALKEEESGSWPKTIGSERRLDI